MANNQYLADLEIWQRQRYTEPPALATAEGKGFRSIRRWALQFYPDSSGGSSSTPELHTSGAGAPDNEVVPSHV
jgi:hypothetical protein